MSKFTMYWMNDFGMGYRKTELTELEVEVKPHAQYERGIYVRCLPKRMRKHRYLTQGYSPNLVVLEGWGHPDPGSMFGPEVTTETPGVTISEAKYSACDPGWSRDFGELLAAYIAKTGAKVLYDFRGHSPGSRGMVGKCGCFSCTQKEAV